MKMSERDAEICTLIEDGRRRVELACKFDVSKSRIGQIYNKYLTAKHEEETAPPLKKMLPPRLQNALVYFFSDEHIFEHPEKIKEVPLRELVRRGPMIGKISIRELTTAMLALGYVKKRDPWLKDWEDISKPSPAVQKKG